MPSKFWFLRRLDLFTCLSDAQLHQVGALLHERACRAGADVVVRPTGDRVYVLKQGRVRVMHGDVAVAVLAPGQVFGTSALFGVAMTDQRVVALDEVVVCEAPAGEFIAAMATHPGLAAQVTMALARQIFDLERAVERSAVEPIEGRLAALLLQVATPVEGRLRVHELTQADFAKMIGASRESVSRAIARWERAAILRSAPKRTEILDADALRAVAAGGRTP